MADEDEYWFRLSGVSDLAVGRNVHYCCLSCGIPLAFPDDAYLSSKKDVVDMLRFTHFVRREMRMYDRSRASTLQWHMNKSHYLHVFLHKSMLKSNLAGAEEGSSRWDHQRPFLQSCTRLLKALQWVPGTKPLVMDAAFLDKTSPWCNACNIAATNSENLRALLGIQVNRAARFPGVPDPRTLPIGMRAMHDTYLFMYTMAACIATMLTASCAANNSPTQIFRLDCLIRLYVGYLIFTVATVQNSSTSVFGDMSFEHWYMFYFSHVQLWERREVDVLHKKNRQAYTGFLTRLGPPMTPDDAEGTALNEHNFHDGNWQDRGDNMSIPDVLARVARVAEDLWFAIDVLNVSSTAVADVSVRDERRALHKQYHDWLPWKKHAPSAANWNGFLSSAAATLAPPPFCCVSDNDFYSGPIHDHENNNEQRSYSQAALKRELFFFRFYENTSMHFASRPDLHRKMRDYLRDLFLEVRLLPVQNRVLRNRNRAPARLGDAR